MNESNPFPSQIPGDTDRAYFEEQAETLRETHQKNQAGDTTFSADLLLELSKTQEFTLGSRGRFYHETYGLIQAIYVQFAQMVGRTSVGAPVGLIPGLESYWQATNDITSSDSSLALGLLCADRIPDRGEFGWVLQTGVNLYDSKVSGSYKVRDKIIWLDSDILAHESGVAVGTALVDSTSDVIPVGGLLVNTLTPGEWSRIGIRALTDTVVNNLLGIETLTSNFAQLSASVKTQNDSVRASVDFLSTRLLQVNEAGTQLLGQVEEKLSLSAQYLADGQKWASSAEDSANQAALKAQASVQTLRTVQLLHDETGNYVKASLDNAIQAGFETAKSKSNASISETFATQASDSAASAQSSLDQITTIIGDFDSGAYVTTAHFNDTVTTLSDATQAVSDRVTTIESSYVTTGAMNTAINAKASELTTAYTAADSALAGSFTTLLASYTPTSGMNSAISAAVSAEATARANAVSAEATQRGLISTRLDNFQGTGQTVEASYVTLNTAIVDESGARALAVSQLTTSISANPNLQMNGGLELGPVMSNIDGVAGIAIDAYAGIVLHIESNGEHVVGTWPTTDVFPNTVYTISWDGALAVPGVNDAGNAIRIDASWFEGPGATGAVHYDSFGQGVNYSSSIDTRRSFTFTTPSNCNSIQIRAISNITVPGSGPPSIQFRRLKLERGPNATTWTTDTSISQVWSITSARTSAFWRVTGVTGGRAQLEIYADANGGAGVDITGDVHISGDLVVDKSIYAGDKLIDGSVTTVVIQQNATQRVNFATGGYVNIPTNASTQLITLNFTKDIDDSSVRLLCYIAINTSDNVGANFYIRVNGVTYQTAATQMSSDVSIVQLTQNFMVSIPGLADGGIGAGSYTADLYATTGGSVQNIINWYYEATEVKNV